MPSAATGLATEPDAELAKSESDDHDGRVNHDEPESHDEPEGFYPTAPCDDLDLNDPVQAAEWERRVMRMATVRIALARRRLETMRIIDADGLLISRELTPDMRPESDTSVETG